MTAILTDLTQTADLVRRRVVYPANSGLHRGNGAEIQDFEDFPARSTGLIHLAAGTVLPTDPVRSGVEILVFGGYAEIDGVPLGPHGYVRAPTGPEPRILAITDTILFVKRGHISAEDRLATLLKPDPALWQNRQGGQLQTLPLHHHCGVAVCLVRYQPGVSAIVRRRLGGEEILVLDGTLLDERSAYPSGTWIRNPPGSLNHPYSLEGCLIYIQTGHLPIV